VESTCSITTKGVLQLRIIITGALLCVAFISQSQFHPVEKIRNDFRTLLQRPLVSHKAFTQSFITDSVLIEKGYFFSEATEKVPMLIYKPLNAGGRKLPVVICLHGTGGSKDGETMKDLLYRFSKMGFMAMSIDGRHHGERVNLEPGKNSYVEAIIKAWNNTDAGKQRHPFFYDTVYDVWRLIDYLETRTDVDFQRIGMMGISKGGIETWMAASVDTRVKVAVPVIAVQSFRWSLENDRWQGRARTIWDAHLLAAKDLGDTGVTRENVKAFWNKLLPGIIDEFDCPSMIRLFAPRPLLLLNTEQDANCPLPGAQLAFRSATEAYHAQSALDKLKIDVAPNEPHRFTTSHMDMMLQWFRKWL
jgi:dienelactone hydrolase